ncbi:MAG: hypothetical protein QM820_12450 [Minicystis sp.]
MRLTDNMITGSYLKSLSRNMKDLSDLNIKVAAGRKYMKMSENPASSVKAFDVRRDLSRIDLYSSTLGDSQALLDEAETSLSSISETAANALTQITQGVNGSLDEPDRKAVANTLRSYQQMILGAANVKASGRYVFGGSSFGSTPFTLNASGKLVYNGQDVDTGTFSAEHRYVDIGIGLMVSPGGAVSSQTALDVAYSGAELLGTGVDANGLPNNLYNLIGEIADKIEAGRPDRHCRTTPRNWKNDRTTSACSTWPSARNPTTSRSSPTDSTARRSPRRASKLNWKGCRSRRARSCSRNRRTCTAPASRWAPSSCSPPSLIISAHN